MAREYSSNDAKRIIERHNALRKILTDSFDFEDTIKGYIFEYIEKYINEDVLKRLKEIPVEELQSEEKGIKIKPLKDNGINTLFEVKSAKLEGIKLIGKDNIRAIRRTLLAFEERLRESTRIKLSYDDKNETTTGLVLFLKKYMVIKSTVSMARILLAKYTLDITEALEASKARFDGIWLFKSRDIKASVSDALTYLDEMLESDYGTYAAEIEEKIKIANSITDGWEFFLKESILFNNTLEELQPGILEARDDRFYGLPNDLSQYVLKEELDLKGFKASLRQYQEIGVKYILRQKRVLLGDEMGLGKTIQAIASMVTLRNRGANYFMVVCPASVLSNWCREIEKFSDLKVTRIYGRDQKVKSLISDWLIDGGVAVTTFESTKSIELDMDFMFDMIIVDEAHYIKNARAKRTGDTLFISSHTERMLLMSGTAIENRVEEMLVLLKYLNQNLYKEAKRLVSIHDAKRFKDLISTAYYRRKREDVLKELPDKIESTEWLSISPEERKIYEADIKEKNFISARRVSWNLDLSKSTKASRLMEILNEALDDGRKVLVFSFYLDTINKLKEYLGDRALPVINGSVQPDERQNIIDKFDEACAGSVLLVQISSGGTGLNIQSASVVILCEPQLKPSIEAQAIARSHRMGQSRTVLVYRLLAENTIDERMMRLLTRKQEYFDTYADESAAKEMIELDMQALMDEEYNSVVK